MPAASGRWRLWYRSRSQRQPHPDLRRQQSRPAEHEAQIQQLESAGQTVVLVMRGEILLGILALRDTLRDDARQAVDALHQLGVQG
ncbi:Lead, cadmium, zinc and mercury-transporting ATPase [Klebsiella pneumoniae]|nr:Lead, cadmium, zinc and mercury-transporting ATPase [Klebsiella pneumoniae]